MKKPIIEVNNLSKIYTLGERQPYYSFRDTISGIFHTPLRKDKLEKDEFWALKNISFDINEGDVVGVIGRNGAGKSTLLKILSQITPPTEGIVKLRGRVASLLEVGTGFHPELTGRENINLNGAILGMKREEIRNKFKEIVEFAEIEKFLDTPVKHYSSGMYMRLAFAVAAHLEPEILLIDEVLAVGDAQFQKKCLGKIDEISKKSGRTVLFVSHNIGAIKSICNKGILLDYGKISCIGDINKVVNKYLSSGGSSTVCEKKWNKKNAPGDEYIKLHSIKAVNDSQSKVEKINIESPFSVEIEYWNLKRGRQRVAGLHVYNEQGQLLFTTYDLHNNEWRKSIIPVSLVKASCLIPGNLLAEGKIYFNVAVNINEGIPTGHAFEKDVLCLDIIDNFSGNSARGDIMSHWDGIFRPKLMWTSCVVKK